MSDEAADKCLEYANKYSDTTDKLLAAQNEIAELKRYQESYGRWESQLVSEIKKQLKEEHELIGQVQRAFEAERAKSAELEAALGRLVKETEHYADHGLIDNYVLDAKCLSDVVEDARKALKGEGE